MFRTIDKIAVFCYVQTSSGDQVLPEGPTYFHNTHVGAIAWRQEKKMAKRGGEGEWSGELEGKQELLNQMAYHGSRAFFRVLTKGPLTANDLVSELFAESLPPALVEDERAKNLLEGIIRGSLPRIQSIAENRRKAWEGLDTDDKKASVISDQVLRVLKEAYKQHVKDLADKRPLVSAISRLNPGLKAQWDAYMAYLENPTDQDLGADKTPAERAEKRGELKDRKKAIEKEWLTIHVMQGLFEDVLRLPTAQMRTSLGELIKTKETPKGRAVFESLTGIKVKELQDDPGKVLKQVFGSGKTTAATRDLQHASLRAQAFTRQYAVMKDAGPLPGYEEEEEDLRAQLWDVRLWRWLKNLFV